MYFLSLCLELSLCKIMLEQICVLSGLQNLFVSVCLYLFLSICQQCAMSSTGEERGAAEFVVFCVLVSFSLNLPAMSSIGLCRICLNLCVCFCFSLNLPAMRDEQHT